MNSRLCNNEIHKSALLGLLLLGAVLLPQSGFAFGPPPVITAQPVGQAVVAGESATFQVGVSSVTTLSYQWRKDGVDIPGATESTYSINPVSLADIGTYSVRVVNGGGSVTSAAAALILQSWTAQYNGSWDGPDYLTATVVDEQGNVYVTGYADMVESRSWDYVTIKYDATGTLLWHRVYDGPNNNDDDIPTALTLDGAGNVIVTGSSAGANALDYTTIKYDPDGNALWVARFDGASSSDDQASAVAVDANGNVFVTGSSITGNKFRYATVKYSSAGQQLWVQTYAGPANSYDQASSIALDTVGNVYVTGLSKGSSSLDYATVKYSNDGSPLWAARYDGPAGGDDRAVQVVVDTAQNVYVTGSSVGSIDEDYATLKYGPDGTQLWVARYNGPADRDDEAVALALDPAGNLIVSGSSEQATGQSDYTTLKYSPLGEPLWVARYNGPADDHDEAVALALDPNGDVYVTGGSETGGAGCDFATVKYLNADGSEAWVARFDSDGNDDTAVAVAVDDQFNVYVGGRAFNSPDYVLVKYQTVSDPADATAVCALHTDSTAGLTPEGFTFGLSAPVGVTFVIEASSNGRDWAPIATNVSDSAAMVFTDPAAANLPMRFYRAVLPAGQTSALESGNSNEQQAPTGNE